MAHSIDYPGLSLSSNFQARVRSKSGSDFPYSNQATVLRLLIFDSKVRVRVRELKLKS